MPRAPAEQAILVQILSLNLLLLAFFIALTRLSTAEGVRRESVSASLGATFATEGRPTASAARFTSSLGNALSEAAPLERLGELIRTEISLARTRDVVPGEVMELTVDSDRLFIGATARIDPRWRRFLERLAAALAEPPPGVRYEVEIATSIQHGEDDAQRTQALASARSAFLGSVLSAAGAPPSSLATGVEPGPPGRLRMLFQVRPADEPPPPFARESR